MIGEILPQSLCTKFSLPIGSYTRHFTYFCIYLTTVASYPLSKLVDLVLGAELPTRISRATIKEMIKKSRGLQEQQCQIINAALDLKNKHVSDIMVRLENVFMIHVDESLNFEMIAGIYNSGYSRIPVYDRNRSDIVGWLHIKDLALIDPEDEITVSKLIEYYKRRLVCCLVEDSIVGLFEMFQKSSTHLAFVQESGGGEVPAEKSLKRMIGIVTLHDVMQALFQSNFIQDDPKGKAGINYLKRIIDNQKRRSASFFAYPSSSNNNNAVSTKINVYDSSNRLIESNVFPDVSETKMKREFKVSWQTKFNILQILASN